MCSRCPELFCARTVADPRRFTPSCCSSCEYHRHSLRYLHLTLRRNVSACYLCHAFVLAGEGAGARGHATGDTCGDFPGEICNEGTSRCRRILVGVCDTVVRCRKQLRKPESHPSPRRAFGAPRLQEKPVGCGRVVTSLVYIHHRISPSCLFLASLEP